MNSREILYTLLRSLPVSLVLVVSATPPLFSQTDAAAGGSSQLPDDRILRVATFNAAMYRNRAGQLAEELATGTSSQARAVAEIIRAVHPDVLLINEIDYQADLEPPLRLFLDKYLAKSETGERLTFRYQFSAPVNTGIPSGQDLDHDGNANGPSDCLGYGDYRGQYGMAVLSRIPIQFGAVRTFQNLRWRSMPGAHLPIDPATGKSYYSDDALEVIPLSSKSHWDLPLQWGSHTIHLLVCHPTPPVFDGAEDRNGLRNHDEIRLWADYIDPSRSSYVVDDQGRAGGLRDGDFFIIAGDLNADPNDGDSHPRAIAQLLEHPLINAATIPTSGGGTSAAREQGKKNLQHVGAPAHDTADFSDDGSGNLRVDYLLPSRQLNVVQAGIYWPESTDLGYAAVATASDHRLVWIDVALR